MEPAAIDVHLARGVLTLAGERKAPTANGDKGTVHMDERLSGRFRRVVSLPDDIYPGAVNADYRDGVLRVSIQRKASTQPRRIEVH